MNILFTILGVLTLALVGACGVALGLPGDPERWAREREAVLGSIPDQALRSSLRREAFSAGSWAEEWALRLRFQRVKGLRPVLGVVSVRARVAFEVLPLATLAAGLGIVAGLLRRRLLIDRTGFHSVTWSYLGKALAGGSGALYAYSGLSPLGPPIWTLYVAAASFAAGAALFVSNLPPKL